MNNIVIILVFFVSAFEFGIAENLNRTNDLLQHISNSEDFEESIITDLSWVEYPVYTDRNSWEQLIPKDTREAYITEGEKYLDYDWPAITATSYMDYERIGSREPNHAVYIPRRTAFQALVMAELMEGKGRFMDQIINGVWVYMEQTWWGTSAHLRLQNRRGLPDVKDPVIDLGVSNISSILAWTHYFFKDEFDKINPLISERMRYEITSKVLQPIYDGREHWWQGFTGDFVNNWNTHCNYNLLNTLFLIEEDPDKIIGILKIIMSSLDQFINYYNNDGVSEEGPGYWGMAGAKLYESLELLHRVSNGKIDIFENEKIKNIGEYITKVYINDPYWVNFAGASPKMRSNPSIIYRYGQRINNQSMSGFGAFLAKKYNWGDEPEWGQIELALNNLKMRDEILSAEPIEPLFKDFWFPDTGLGGARDNEGSHNGFYFAAKGGYNAESHNHNDVGSFILYYNGNPLLVDSGYGTYTQQTFSSERYDIWTMQSEYHNVPVINGFGQPNGREYKARDVTFSADERKVKFSADITKAYPEAAMVEYWTRSYKLIRGESFTIIDDYELKEAKGGTAYHFLTSCDVEKKEGALKLTGKDFTVLLDFDASLVEPFVEEIDWGEDRRLDSNWPEGLSRIRLVEKKPEASRINQFTITEINQD